MKLTSLGTRNSQSSLESDWISDISNGEGVAERVV